MVVLIPVVWWTWVSSSLSSWFVCESFIFVELRISISIALIASWWLNAPTNPKLSFKVEYLEAKVSPLLQLLLPILNGLRSVHISYVILDDIFVIKLGLGTLDAGAVVTILLPCNNRVLFDHILIPCSDFLVWNINLLLSLFLLIDLLFLNLNFLLLNFRLLFQIFSDYSINTYRRLSIIARCWSRRGWLDRANVYAWLRFVFWRPVVSRGVLLKRTRGMRTFFNPRIQIFGP